MAGQVSGTVSGALESVKGGLDQVGDCCLQLSGMCAVTTYVCRSACLHLHAIHTVFACTSCGLLMSSGFICLSVVPSVLRVLGCLSQVFRNKEHDLGTVQECSDVIRL